LLLSANETLKVDQLLAKLLGKSRVAPFVAAYEIGQAIIFLPCGFFLLSSFFPFLLLFSSPNLSGRILDVYHTSTHGVALVRISNAGMKCAARGALEMQDAKKSPTRMCADAQHDGRPEEYMWRPLFNAAKFG